MTSPARRATRAWRWSCRTCADTARARARSTDACSTISPPSRTLLPVGVPRALRGSSMGGYLAITAAERLQARAVVAICPASHAMLLRGLRTQDLDFEADRPSLEAFLEAHPLEPPDVPLLLLHADGDERVPVEHSRELADRAPQPKLVIVPGGHHRSVQHDAELQDLALRWLRRALA